MTPQNDTTPAAPEQAIPDLDAIRARCEATTAGPWEAAEMLRWPGRWDVWEADGRKCIAEVLWERDAEFIAHVRTDVEALLAEVERLRVVEVASIGAHALLEDAEAAIERVRALHKPTPIDMFTSAGCGPDGVCEHDECPTTEVQVCAHCACGGWLDDWETHGYTPADDLDRWTYPCATLRVLDPAAGNDGPEVSRG